MEVEEEAEQGVKEAFSSSVARCLQLHGQLMRGMPTK